jgi:hypothetical protein
MRLYYGGERKPAALVAVDANVLFDLATGLDDVVDSIWFGPTASCGFPAGPGRI